jgi:2,4-didehydro-3-deoxy-L-rhamnonate hydrolase
MAIHLLRFSLDGRAQWGVVAGQRITRIPVEFATTGDLVTCAHIADLAALDGPTVDVSAVEILSPVTRNQQFVCQGANYRQHMIESGVDPDAKTYNMIFTKAPTCIVPATSDVVRPAEVRFLDYEVELGLVIRRAIRGRVVVTDDNLHEFIAGAVIVNDYSARDVQIPQTQFYKGKSYRTFGPVGPYLCLLDAGDIARLHALELELTVNGELRQRDTTANLVYKPAETLTELSGVHDFQPGDLLSTGTPSGCALAVPSPVAQRVAGLFPERRKWQTFFAIQAKRPYLQPGDVVEARIRSADGVIDLGVQRNRIVAE